VKRYIDFSSLCIAYGQWSRGATGVEGLVLGLRLIFHVDQGRQTAPPMELASRADEVIRVRMPSAAVHESGSWHTRTSRNVRFRLAIGGIADVEGT
jgi:hypothetical protein